MKIVKLHKVNSAHSEQFGIWSGKTLAEISVGKNHHQISHGGCNDQVDHIKVGDGSHEAFLWFDSMQEVYDFGGKLIELAIESDTRKIDAIKAKLDDK
jgi:hypothetical protein